MSEGRTLVAETVPAALDAVAPLAAKIERACDELGLADDVAFKLNLALDELVTNLVTHGGSALPVAVSLTAHAGRLELLIVDSGPPFDPALAPAPDTSLAIEERPIGGLGLHLIRTLMDEVRYSRDGDRNRLVLVMRT